MTDQEFRIRSFKNNMRYDFKDPKNGLMVECLVIGINFDGGTLHLWPLPTNINRYGSDDTAFWVSYEFAHLPKPTFKKI